MKALFSPAIRKTHYIIHKASIIIPHGLISEIEKWVLQRLRENIPFICVYGIFRYFYKECVESGIPTEESLYSVLREMSHPLLAYPKLPSIYLKRSMTHRIPVAIAVEQFIQDSERIVSYDELKTYIIDKLLLKDIQFNLIITQIPNTIRTQDGGFLHTDLLNLDVKTINELVSYIHSIIIKEGHVSAVKIFKDKMISCRILGIHDPKSLFSLVKLKFDNKFDLQHYPQIRFLKKDDEYSSKGIVNVVVNFIKNKNTYCSYQELQEEFVEKLGYNENSMRSVIYQKDIYKYLRDSVIHKSSIEWNDEKQMHIETAAVARYDEYVKSGKCYGLIKKMIEEEPLPSIGNGLYWTPYLLADLLTSQGRLAIFGSERNAFLPVPNKFGD